MSINTTNVTLNICFVDNQSFYSGFSLGFNTVLLYFCISKLFEISKKISFINIILFFSLILTYIESITIFLQFIPQYKDFYTPIIIIDGVTFLLMIQGCNWIYYYRSRLFLMKQKKYTTLDNVIIIFPIIILCCQIPDVILYWLQFFNNDYLKIFEIDSSITIIIEIVCELFLYSHLFIKISKIETLKNHFKIHKRIIIKIIIIALIILMFDLLVIISAFLGNIFISLSFKSTGYFFRYWLIIELFYEIIQPFKLIKKKYSSGKTTSETFETNLKTDSELDKI